MDRANTLPKMLALECATELDDLWEKHPHGITLSVLQRHMGYSYDHAATAARKLVELRKAQWLTRPDRRVGYLVPLNYECPVWDLTQKQKATLDFLIAHADENGIVHASMRDIARGSPISKGAVVAHLDSLDRKRYIRFLRRGDHHRKTKFKVYPNGDASGPSQWPGRPAIDQESVAE